METVEKKDFVEIKFTGYVNGKIFDSNIVEDLKKIDDKAKVKETIVIVGQGMVVSGLDNALEGKEIGKEYEIILSPKEGFGDRKKELVKTIPLSTFTEKKINPFPGQILAMDNSLARVITVSGARVLTDFNNPLAGKEITYKYKIVRRVENVNEKTRVVLSLLLRFVPDFSLEGEKIVVKGPKQLEGYIKILGDKFKELVGKELGFEEKREDNTEISKSSVPETSEKVEDVPEEKKEAQEGKETNQIQ